ncbi:MULTISPECIES: hypothetical protein [unclassified Rhizobacter]|uniref:hypothetical protein n=1 Tax=unclassified Rhizobacter TaxID=2640088 RepID=UPI000715CCE2|nr:MULTISPECIES: hypothetical protein [unclassified Rhizobacter]KQW10856.1 hypothetical protein ASC98_02555 [Rhizobacter sp. Root1238]
MKAPSSRDRGIVFQDCGIVPLQAPHEDGVCKKKVSTTPMRLRSDMYEQRVHAKRASLPEPWTGQESGSGILRKPGSAGKQGLQVSFDEEVKLATFVRHSPSAKNVLKVFKECDDARPDIEFIVPGQEAKILEDLLQTVEHTMANAVTPSRPARLREAVNMLRNDLVRHAESSQNKEFASHCRALLTSHRQDLDAISPPDDGDREEITKPSHDIARLGEVVTSMRRIKLGMTVARMQQAFSDVKNEGSGLRYVERQLGMAMTTLAQEMSTSKIELPCDTVSDLWQSWTGACHENEVRGHFVRQWWMHSGALREDSTAFDEALGRLSDSNQFDDEQVRQGLRQLLDAPMRKKVRIALLEDFCDIGQSGRSLEKTLQKLGSEDDATVDETLDEIAPRIAAYEYEQHAVQPARSMIRAAMADFKEAVEELPLEHASVDEKKRQLEPLAVQFRDAVLDALEVADPDCRRQAATSFFGAMSRLETALERGSATDLLTVLKSLKSDLDQIAFRKPFAKAAIGRALNGMLDMVGDDLETAGRVVTWLSMGLTDALEEAFMALTRALDTRQEPSALRNLVDVMFRLQTQD